MFNKIFLSQYHASSHNWDYDKAPKEPKTFKGVMTRFGSYTSLQGIPFILRAKRWYSRLLWTLLFIAALGLTSWQFIEVLNKFLAQDTSTSIKLGYANLEFPSVTICNINPIRLSAVNETSTKLVRFIKTLTPPEEYNERKNMRETGQQQSGQGGQQQSGQGGQQQSGQGGQQQSGQGGQQQSGQGGQQQSGQGGQQQSGQGGQQQSGQGGQQQSGQGGQQQSGQGGQQPDQLKRRKRQTEDNDDVVVNDKHRPVSI